MGKLKIITHFDKFVMNPKHMIAGEIIQLMIDTKKKIVIHVDPPVNHARAASYYIGIPENEINDFTAGHLIPAHIEVKKDGSVEHIIVGRSSLETGLHVHHNPESISLAVAILEALLEESDKKHEIKIKRPLKSHEFVFGGKAA